MRPSSPCPADRSSTWRSHCSPSCRGLRPEPQGGLSQLVGAIVAAAFHLAAGHRRPGSGTSDLKAAFGAVLMFLANPRSHHRYQRPGLLWVGFRPHPGDPTAIEPAAGVSSSQACWSSRSRSRWGSDPALAQRRDSAAPLRKRSRQSCRTFLAASSCAGSTSSPRRGRLTWMTIRVAESVSHHRAQGLQEAIAVHLDRPNALSPGRQRKPTQQLHAFVPHTHTDPDADAHRHPPRRQPPRRPRRQRRQPHPPRRPPRPRRPRRRRCSALRQRRCPGCSR